MKRIKLSGVDFVVGICLLLKAQSIFADLLNGKAIKTAISSLQSPSSSFVQKGQFSSLHPSTLSPSFPSQSSLSPLHAKASLPAPLLFPSLAQLTLRKYNSPNERIGASTTIRRWLSRWLKTPLFGSKRISPSGMIEIPVFEKIAALGSSPHIFPSSSSHSGEISNNVQDAQTSALRIVSPFVSPSIGSFTSGAPTWPVPLFTDAFLSANSLINDFSPALSSPSSSLGNTLPPETNFAPDVLADPMLTSSSAIVDSEPILSPYSSGPGKLLPSTSSQFLEFNLNPIISSPPSPPSDIFTFSPQTPSPAGTFASQHSQKPIFSGPLSSSDSQHSPTTATMSKPKPSAWKRFLSKFGFISPAQDLKPSASSLSINPFYFSEDSFHDFWGSFDAPIESATGNWIPSTPTTTNILSTKSREPKTKQYSTYGSSKNRTRVRFDTVTKTPTRGSNRGRLYANECPNGVGICRTKSQRSKPKRSKTIRYKSKQKTIHYHDNISPNRRPAHSSYHHSSPAQHSHSSYPSSHEDHLDEGKQKPVLPRTSPQDNLVSMGSEDQEQQLPLKFGERKRKYVPVRNYIDTDEQNDGRKNNINNEWFYNSQLSNDDNNYKPFYNSLDRNEHEDNNSELKDRGHEKHGWKNIYHKEEWGVNKKFHDVWRDKDWKNRFNDEQLPQGRPNSLTNDGLSEQGYSNTNNREYEPAESSQHSVEQYPQPDNSNVSSASVNVTIWHH